MTTRGDVRGFKVKYFGKKRLLNCGQRNTEKNCNLRFSSNASTIQSLEEMTCSHEEILQCSKQNSLNSEADTNNHV